MCGTVGSPWVSLATLFGFWETLINFSESMVLYGPGLPGLSAHKLVQYWSWAPADRPTFSLRRLLVSLPHHGKWWEPARALRRGAAHGSTRVLVVAETHSPPHVQRASLALVIEAGGGSEAGRGSEEVETSARMGVFNPPTRFRCCFFTRGLQKKVWRSKFQKYGYYAIYPGGDLAPSIS